MTTIKASFIRRIKDGYKFDLFDGCYLYAKGNRLFSNNNGQENLHTWQMIDKHFMDTYEEYIKLWLIITEL